MKAAKRNYTPCVAQAFLQARKDNVDYWGHIAQKYSCFKKTESNVLKTSFEDANRKDCKRRTRKGVVDLWKSVAANLAYVKSRENLIKQYVARQKPDDFVTPAPPPTPRPTVQKRKDPVVPCDKQPTGVTTKIPTEVITNVIEKVNPPCDFDTHYLDHRGDCRPFREKKRDCSFPIKDLCDEKKNPLMKKLEALGENYNSSLMAIAAPRAIEIVEGTEKKCRQDVENELLKMNMTKAQIEAIYGDCSFEKQCYQIPDIYKSRRERCYEQRNEHHNKYLPQATVDSNNRVRFLPETDHGPRLGRLLKEVKSELRQGMIDQGLKSNAKILELLESITDIKVGSSCKDDPYKAPNLNAIAGLSKSGDGCIRIKGYIVYPDSILKQVIAHELGHLISPYFSGSIRNKSYGFVDSTFLSGSHPFEGNLKQCFEKEVPEYHKDTVVELIADNIATYRLAAKLKRIKGQKARWEFVKGALSNRCLSDNLLTSQQGVSAKREKNKEEYETCLKQRDAGEVERCYRHPIKEDRVNQLYFANPGIREALNCKDEGDNTPVHCPMKLPQENVWEWEE